MHSASTDGDRAVVENLGLIIRQLLPSPTPATMGRLIGRLSMSRHVAEVLGARWGDLEADVTSEIEREVAVAVWCERAELRAT